MSDDYAGSISTTGMVSVGGSRSGNIEIAGDTDWFRITLTAGQTYQFDLTGGSLANPFLRLRNSAGTSLAFDDDSGSGLNSRITYTATSTGTFYLSVGSSTTAGVGTYTVSVTNTTVSDDYADEPSDGSAPVGTVSVGGSTTGFIGPADANDTFGDVDAFRVSLVAGQTYEFRMQGTSVNGQTLSSGIFTIRNSSFTTLATSTEGSNVAISFTAPTTGDYYIRAGSGGSSPGQGGYRVSVTNTTVSDDYADEPSDASAPVGTVSVGGSTTGFIGPADANDTFGDVDAFRVSLVAGQTYEFRMQGTSVNGQTLSSGIFTIRNSSFTTLATSTEGSNVALTFTAPTTGDYYIRAGSGGSSPGQGGYRVSVTNTTVSDDYADEPSDASAPVGTVSVGGSTTGFIGPADSNDTFGDKDVFLVNLVAGQAYQFNLQGAGVNGQTLPLGLFTIRSPGNFNSVLATSASGNNVTETFVAEVTGAYYIRVGVGNSPTDQGSYRLSVANVTPVSTNDDFPDMPGDTSALNGVPTLSANGGSRSGVIEASGDTDIFSLTLTQGRTYQFSLNETASTFGVLSNHYMTIRSGSAFDIRLDQGSGIMTFVAPTSGVYYLRIGAADGTDVGGYRVTAADQGVVIITPPPSPIDPAVPPLDNFLRQLDHIVDQFDALHFDLVFDENIWNSVALAALALDQADVLTASTRVASTLDRLPFGLFFNAAEIALDVASAPTLDLAKRALFVGLFDKVFEYLFVNGFAYAGGAIVAAGSTYVSVGLATIQGWAVGYTVSGAFSAIVYDLSVEGLVEFIAEEIWDNVVDPPGLSMTSLTAPASLVLPANVSVDEAELVRFDSSWYLSNYADAAAAVANGSVGSAYAHFLTVGIDLGYQPNAVQSLTRAMLGLEVAINDPAALGNSALFTHALATYAGDGLSSAESAAAGAVSSAHNGALIADADLCAIASRRAIDLVANLAASAAGRAEVSANAGWADDWSNGNDLTQQFAETFETLLGVNPSPIRYSVFVVASPNTSAAAVLAQLQTQSNFAAAMANSAFDTIGIGEYGGVWVVILADREPGYVPRVPGSDMLVAFTDYGSQGNDVMYAGSRTATLYGLDGADRIVGGANADRLHGDDGADLLDGGAGQDQIFGGIGDDTVIWDAADDLANVQGGNGVDMLVFTSGAAPTTFSLVSHGFELAEGRLTDTGGNPWASQILLYNSAWQLDFHTVVNDNGSRTEMDYDQANAFSWSTNFNQYDAGGLLDLNVTVFDSGVQSAYDFDQVNAFAWTSNWNQYAAGGALDINVTAWDDGTETSNDFDAGDLFDWESNWISRDALGQLDLNNTVFDNGVQSAYDFDQADAFNWSSNWNQYAAGGALDINVTVFDDGTSNSNDFDQANAFDWSSNFNSYNSTGEIDYNIVVFDNGNTAVMDYDQDDAFVWTTIWRLYNPGGVLIGEVITPDPGG